MNFKYVWSPNILRITDRSFYVFLDNENIQPEDFFVFFIDFSREGLWQISKQKKTKNHKKILISPEQDECEEDFGGRGAHEVGGQGLEDRTVEMESGLWHGRRWIFEGCNSF